MKAEDKPKYVKEARALYESIDIEKLISNPNDLGERRKNREQGVARIHQLADLGVVGKIIKEPIDISTGLLSAVFDIETSEGRKIVKFREFGILAEASAYIEWAQENVPVPRVLKASQAYDLDFGYLIMEPVLTDGGNLAPTGASITEDRRDEIEKFLGTNLAMMNKVKGNYFGNILDQNPHVQFFKLEWICWRSNCKSCSSASERNRFVPHSIRSLKATSNYRVLF